MPSLRDLQSSFAAHLFEDDPAAIVPWIRSDGIEPTARLRIYRNNLHEGFEKTLALEYPVISRLVGQDYFRQLALAFLASRPSTSGDLHHVGATFSTFLERQFADSSYLYLTDVAALEWAHQECLTAEDAVPLDPAALREVPADLYGTLRFTLLPATRLVHSRFPILKIWKANQIGSATEEVDLDAGADSLLVFRHPSGIYFRHIPEHDYRLLAAFAAGHSLDEALELSLAADAKFDLSTSLRRCIEYGVISQIAFSKTAL